jgi:hypothetical protein
MAAMLPRRAAEEADHGNTASAGGRLQIRDELVLIRIVDTIE